MNHQVFRKTLNNKDCQVHKDVVENGNKRFDARQHVCTFCGQYSRRRLEESVPAFADDDDDDDNDDDDDDVMPSG